MLRILSKHFTGNTSFKKHLLSSAKRVYKRDDFHSDSVIFRSDINMTFSYIVSTYALLFLCIVLRLNLIQCL